MLSANAMGSLHAMENEGLGGHVGKDGISPGKESAGQTLETDELGLCEPGHNRNSSRGFERAHKSGPGVHTAWLMVKLREP